MLKRFSAKIRGSQGYAKFSSSQKYDAIVIGGGHNGLVASYYLAKNAALKTLVLEQRPVVGGAAVTEEIFQGYKFSRASYLFSLFRPQIIEDLQLKKRGLKFYFREPSSFTPLLDGRHLLLGSANLNAAQIAKFSQRDADNFPRYEHYLDEMIAFLEPFFDEAPLTMDGTGERLDFYRQAWEIVKRAKKLSLKKVPALIELLTAPSTKILDHWFESEPLKSTLATDAVIGALTSPSQAGSAYVLLHHVMGQVDGRKGAWAYVEGGMGRVSELCQEAAKEVGVQVRTGARVVRILLDDGGRRVQGVELETGEKILARTVLSNATAHETYLKLLPSEALPADLIAAQKSFDYESPVFKINLALKCLPAFSCMPARHTQDGHGPEHCGTIHLASETMAQIDQAYQDTLSKKSASHTPIIEMTIPSVYDRTLVNTKEHPQHQVAGLFVQYAPYSLPWEDKTFKENFVKRVFDTVEQYAPGFRESIVAYEALSPKDLEREFGLTRGNIFHGAISLDQLYFNRAAYRSPALQGLYMCGSSAHPGGGVTGAPGRNCARVVLGDLHKRSNQ